MHKFAPFLNLGSEMMTEVLSAGQMRALETEAIESGQVTGLELMERAGRGVVEAVFAQWPDLVQAPGWAAVLCGPGNNGGDGFVIARLLRDWGWEVDLWLLGDAEKLPPDARAIHDRWCAMGGAVRPYGDEGEGAFALPDRGHAGRALLVDALFGTGLTRPLEGVDAFGLATQMASRRGARVVAVDVPSGLCADSGRYLRREGAARYHEAVRADLTVSFHAAKLGHYLQDGPAACGALAIADIGLEGPEDPLVAQLVDAPGAELLRKGQGHKYGHGHALILSGDAGQTGAARLAARAALRIGAGLVTLGVPPGAQAEVAAQITALMMRVVPDIDALAELLDDPRFSAIGLGPGMGLSEATASLAAVAVSSGRACVLDADALSVFADRVDELFDLTAGTACVLTPHGGEFARLFPDLAERLVAAPTTGPAMSRVDAAREAARRAGCVLLLKGADTVIAAADGRVSIHAACYGRAAPWLATAGAGDVLTGLIAGLMARGFGPMQASELAAWCHVEAARHFGPGLIAEDLPEALPGVLRGLDAQ
jgi:hydroxyethylthiazole kinase-like uncharacterized protein yjeF